MSWDLYYFSDDHYFYKLIHEDNEENINNILEFFRVNKLIYYPKIYPEIIKRNDNKFYKMDKLPGKEFLDLINENFFSDNEIIDIIDIVSKYIVDSGKKGYFNKDLHTANVMILNDKKIMLFDIDDSSLIIGNELIIFDDILKDLESIDENDKIVDDLNTISIKLINYSFGVFLTDLIPLFYSQKSRDFDKLIQKILGIYDGFIDIDDISDINNIADVNNIVKINKNFHSLDDSNQSKTIRISINYNSMILIEKNKHLIFTDIMTYN